MANRIQLAVLVLLAGLLVWNISAQRAVVDEVEELSERMALLEERSQERAARRGMGRNGKAGRAMMRMRSKLEAARVGASEGDTGAAGASGRGVAELTEIPESMRDELVEIVEAEGEEARQNRRQEWRERFQDGMRSSVDEFVEDRGISDDVAEQMHNIFDDGIKEGMRLYQEMENEEISWYQFRQEMRANREAWEQDLEAILSEEDYQEVLEVFPRRHR